MSRSGHVALAGAPNVGKSTLMNALIGSPLSIVSPRAQTTRLPVVGIRTEGDTQYVFHDLPGLLDPAYLLHRSMLAAAHAAIRRADLVLHLHPAPEAPAPPFAAAAGLAGDRAPPVLTVYTKADLLEPDRRVGLAGAGSVVSAADAASLAALLAEVRERLPERDFEFDPEDIGTQPLRFFVVEYLREAAFARLDEEVPYAVTAEVEEFRESERPIYIRATLYVERESQRGIVVGRGGRMVRAIGTATRERLETLIGAPVYLDLRVKVLPHWRRSPVALARFGFPVPTSESDDP